MFKGLNPNCHLLALLGAHHILHVSRIRVKNIQWQPTVSFSSYLIFNNIIFPYTVLEINTYIYIFTIFFSELFIIFCKSGRLRLKCDGTQAENRFCLSAKRTSPFKSAGASVQSTTGSRGVRISGSNAGYTVFRGSVKGTGYLLHSPVSPSHPLPCVNLCHHVSTGL